MPEGTNSDVREINPQGPVEVVQGTNAQQAAAVLDADATEPYETPGSLAERLKQYEVKKDSDAPPPPKRGRGRPPGSRNKSTLAKEASTVSPGESDRRTGTQRMAADAARRSTATAAAKKDTDERTPEEKRAAYNTRVEELAVSISDNVNGHIAELLGAAGLPSSMIYKPGREPKHVKTDSPYTDLVDRVMVPDNTVESWAKLWAQVELTDMGKRLSGSGGGSGNAGLVIAALLSVLGTVQYLQGLNQFAKEMKPMLDAYKQSQDLIAQQERNANAGV